MSTPRFQDVLDTLAVAITSALNAASISAPAQVVVGQPVSTELTKILNPGDYQVSIFDRRGTMQSEARYPEATLFPIGTPVSTLTVTVTPPNANNQPWTIALGGTVGAGAYIKAFVGYPVGVASVSCAANETLAAAATALATAINALAISGVVATVSGTNVMVTNSPICLANVSGTGYVLAQEVNRIGRSVQVSIWTPNPQLRFTVSDAIQSAVGTYAQPFLTLSDGTQALCLLAGGAGSGLDDDSQSSYSLYLEHLIFHVEYAVLKTFIAYPIQDVDATLTVNADPSEAVISPGGPL
jgi:hypothetical protein